MNLVIHQLFRNEDILFEGSHFIGCTFIHCTVRVHSLNFDYDRCTFEDCVFHIAPEVPYSQLLRPLLTQSVSIA
ncbi:hypothetical protein [Paenibacillus sp. SYP-B4298]|uniref:hypothetical protein n=1 Tax=Paenibacillus sp. SYP-B4298 TaxID=2996034 RepID=UPI0022DD41FE|nr:hypothetical protein [Paenibacillus sp. SYP-B4298]